MAVVPTDPQTAALVSGDPAAGLSWPQREPALLVGQITTLLALATGAGLQISDQTSAAIVAFATAVAAIAQALIVRSRVAPEPKTQARVNLAKAEAFGQADASAKQLRDQLESAQDDAHNANAILDVLHSVRDTGPVSGPSPASALHPLVEDPIIPGVNDQ